MEEILSSIRRIISEEESPSDRQSERAAADGDDDEMLLTEVVGADGEVAGLYDDPEPEPARPAPVAAPAPAPRPQPQPKPASPANVHDQAARAAQGSMARLQHALQTRQAPMHDDDAYQPQGGETVEGLVYQILKPMLREWIDRNLPGIVEGMVAAEIRKMTGNG